MKEISVKEPVRLRWKNLANGNVSLYLDTYTKDRRRIYEFLKLYLVPERTRADREANKQTLQLANSIKAKRIVELRNGEYGFKRNIAANTRFFDYYRAMRDKYAQNNPSGTSGGWASCLSHLEIYEKRRDMTFADVTPRWIQGFKDYLCNASALGSSSRKRACRHPLSTNSQACYFRKLRACINRAYKDGVINANPMRGISRIAEVESKRIYLTVDEVRKLAGTECPNLHVRRAFLFSCLTGLRYSDVSRLTWGDVEMQDGFRRIVFRQKKTGGQEYLDISPQAAVLMGDRASDGTRPFGDLPSLPYVNQTIKRWAQSAGVGKVLSFHTVRHTSHTSTNSLITNYVSAQFKIT